MKLIKLMKRFRWLIITFLAINGISFVNGQEHVDFGQYTLFQPTINIASAGSYTVPALSIYGRTQWTSIEGAPSKLGSQFIMPFSQNSISFSLKQESIGVHSRQVLMGGYTHEVDFRGENHLSFGLGLGIEMVNSRYSEAAPNDSRDLNFGNDKKAIGPEMEFGLYFYNNNLFFGFSIPSLIYNEIVEDEGVLSGNTQLASKFWHYYFLGGYKFQLNPKLDLRTSSLIKLNQNTPVEFDLNAEITLENKYGIGLSYRTKREILFMANYDFQYRMKIGYCYHSYFAVNGHLLSGHEIVCVFVFAKPKEAIIQTPRF